MATGAESLMDAGRGRRLEIKAERRMKVVSGWGGARGGGASEEGGPLMWSHCEMEMKAVER